MRTIGMHPALSAPYGGKPTASEGRQAAIAAADATLEAAGLPTYTQLLVTVEQLAAEECAA